MAVLASSAVVIGDVYFDDGVSGRRHKAVSAILTLTGQGGLTNNIPATLFNLRLIKRVYAARLSDSTVIAGCPSYDETLLVLGKNDGTGTPTDISGTLKVLVAGVE